ncbi:G/U mismatch-specific DNA glycosylase [Nitrospirillum viridazoti]|uniref:Double-stranded uracil-DNA glycosylase n=1 Tax=Nitrospirillum viridazoti CBAmc TaxID=1441467 RepID=A0A248JVZ7_9PROT|nr:G/U mismatch-specific DNA glycosylase [Nitrospirillum amazonense]ASG22903.1 double-stranded uracil-DNA glycosylase [Nitrospirillum amazonense CBAmc]TWB31487.1 G/U mismatch-specific uracil-DNA glycosylase [Nitrospirillum amazonense]
MTVTPTLPDVLAPDLDVVFCGINPGLAAAAAGHHFLGRGNRFWRVIHLAGFTPGEIRPENDRSILQYRCGLTAVVDRPTAQGAQVAVREFVAASARFERKITRYAPRFVAFLGKAAYAALSGQAAPAWGPQEQLFGGAIVWVLPNPSGRNRAFTVEQLVSAYRRLHRAVAEDRQSGMPLATRP